MTLNVDADACNAVLRDPLSVIDPNCDLDHILEIGHRNVVDAIRTMCPGIPGLTSLTYTGTVTILN